MAVAVMSSDERVLPCNADASARRCNFGLAGEAGARESYRVC